MKINLLKKISAVLALAALLSCTAFSFVGCDDRSAETTGQGSEAPAADAATEAQTDAPEVYYVRTPEQPCEKDEITYDSFEFDTLEAAKAKANDKYLAACGYAVYDSEGKYVWGINNEYVTYMMYHAKRIADFCKENHYSYGSAQTNPAVTYHKYIDGGRRLTEKVTSCDRFVGWVLYDMGYTDQPVNGGMYVWNSDDSHNLMDFLEKRGYEQVKNAREYKAGDIVFVNPVQSSGGTPYGAHVFICAGDVGSRSMYYRYDMGSQIRIRCEDSYAEYARNGQPFTETIGNLFCVYRPTQTSISEIAEEKFPSSR